MSRDTLHAELVAILVIVAVVGGLVVSEAQAPPASPAPAAPAGVPQDAVERADAAMKALQGALLGRLREEMARGGPPAAITVCRDEAQAITARIGREQGIAIGRTSARLRNPANAAPAWARQTVASNEGRRAADVQQVVIDLGDRVGVMRPIGTVDTCTNCHGPEASMAPAVREVLAKAYPNDQATGFAPGDLRGWMWVEVPTR